VLRFVWQPWLGQEASFTNSPSSLGAIECANASLMS
jgi:hypothetical protein